MKQDLLKGLTEEQIAKIKACNSGEELLELAKAEGVEFRTVNGVGTVEEVTNRLVDVVKEIVPGARVQTADVNGGEIERSYGE